MKTKTFLALISLCAATFTVPGAPVLEFDNGKQLIPVQTASAILEGNWQSPRIKGDFKNEVLGGQNHYEFFAKSADSIDASGISDSDVVVDALVTSVLNDYLDGKIATVDASMAEILKRVKQQYPKAKY